MVELTGVIGMFEFVKSKRVTFVGFLTQGFYFSVFAPKVCAMRCKSPRTGAHETSNCRMLTVLMVLIAWSATIAGGGALAWNFICERGFVLRALPGAEHDSHHIP